MGGVEGTGSLQDPSIGSSLDDPMTSVSFDLSTAAAEIKSGEGSPKKGENHSQTLAILLQ